jgi:hypothetical protein
MRAENSARYADGLGGGARVLTGALFVVAIAATARGGVITQVTSFDLSTPFAVGTGASADPGFAFLERFDESLGALTRVDISISGTMHVQGELSQSLVCTIGCVTSAYPFSLEIAHDFGLWPAGLTGPRTIYTGTASGGHIPEFAAFVDFSHDVSFTDTTDLLGFALISSSSTPTGSLLGFPAIVIPPITSALQRGDFDAPVPGIPFASIFPVVSWLAIGTPTGNVGGPPIQGELRSNGRIDLTYTYEDAAPPAVPEPATLMLMAWGWIGLRFVRRRRS